MVKLTTYRLNLPQCASLILFQRDRYDTQRGLKARCAVKRPNTIAVAVYGAVSMPFSYAFLTHKSLFGTWIASHLIILKPLLPSRFTWKKSKLTSKLSSAVTVQAHPCILHLRPERVYLSTFSHHTLQWKYLYEMC